MTLRIAHPPGYVPERAYVISTLLGEHLGLGAVALEEQRADTEIRLHGSEGRLLLGEGLFGTPESAWLSPGSMPMGPLERLDPTGTRLGLDGLDPLAVPFGTATLRLEPDEISIGLDVLGSAFYFLSRYEEVAAPEHDLHERYPVAASLAGREGLVERPVVDEYTELLRAAIHSLWPRLPVREPRFRILPSHDVDHPLCPSRSAGQVLRRAAGDVARRRDPALAARRAAAFLAARRGRFDRDVCNTFDAIMDESERRGLRSAFYFMAGGEDAHDGTYDLHGPWIQRLLGRIHARGHEIGLHPSYGTFRDPELTRAELRTLVEACERAGVTQERWGGRQHYLRFECPTTWRNWEEAGLDYDSTLGFAEQPGFRSGTCHEHPVFDVRARKELRLRERPLVAMDVSLLQYQGLGHDEARARIRKLKRTCRHFNGDFTILWHNNRLLHRGARRLYRDAIDDD